MSEYQYYEFLAIDRPLTAAEMKSLRGISTRARITPVSFFNECLMGLSNDLPKAWRSVQRILERGPGKIVYDEACRALVDLSEAYDLNATRKEFQQAMQNFMEDHKQRKALVQRLVKAGIWKA